MKKLAPLAVFFIISYTSHAQVGIGTTNPQATLDVTEANPSSPTAFSGIAVPRVSVLPSSGNVGGQILYLTTTNQYYFYNGSSWSSLATQVNSFGDIKYGFQAADHNGWVKLDGRAVNTLTSTQQSAATALGIGTNLPDSSNRFIIGKSAIGENSLGDAIGSNTASISVTQANIPNFNMTATTSSEGSHSHTMEITQIYGSVNVGGGGIPININGTNTQTTSADGVHTHNVTVNSGGTGTPIDISTVPSSIVANAFIYLGT